MYFSPNVLQLESRAVWNITKQKSPRDFGTKETEIVKAVSLLFRKRQALQKFVLREEMLSSREQKDRLQLKALKPFK